MKNSRYKFKFRFLLIIALAFFNSASVFSQEESGKILAGVNIEGNRKVSEEYIKIISELANVPKDVNAEDFSHAVQLLWRSNLFSDVQIFVENPDDKYLTAVIKVEEYPSIEDISFIGNDKIDDKNLLKITNLYSGQRIGPSLIRKSEIRIKDSYTEKGHLLAAVHTEVNDTDEEGKVDVIFSIEEGEKIKIKNINFVGNKIFSEKTLRKQLKQTKQDGWLSGGEFEQLKYEEDKIGLINFFKNEGYPDALILSDSISYSADKKYMNILIRVDEGIPYFFRNISFEGNELFPDEQLTALVKINKGDSYNYETIAQAQENISTAYMNFGYMLAQIYTPQKPIGQDSIDVNFVVNEGIPIKIDRINITGNTKTKDKVIRREIVIEPGDIFSYDRIYRSLRNISVLNYFSDLNFDFERNGLQDGSDEVDVFFIVEEKSTDTANMSAGYSQRDGLIGSLGLAMNNFLGNGQQMYIDWTFGKIFRSFQIGFTEPWLFDTRTGASISIFDTRRGGRFYGYDQESKGATLRIGRRLSWPDDYFRGDLIFEYSRNRYFNVSEDLDLLRYLIDRENTTRVSVTQVLSRDSRSNPKDPAIAAEFPSTGSTFAFSTQFSGGILGGTENFIKYNYTSQWFMPMKYDFVLYQNIQMGLINSFDAQSNISLQELFYMGGSALAIGTSLRGYKERSVGPLTSEGRPLGGKVMMKLSTELRFKVSQNPTIYGLVFAEAGNNWIDLSFANPFDLRRSVGVGVRLFMPMIGMIGFDFGYGFDNYDAFGKRVGWLPHFQFGRGF